MTQRLRTALLTGGVAAALVAAWLLLGRGGVSDGGTPSDGSVGLARAPEVPVPVSPPRLAPGGGGETPGAPGASGPGTARGPGDVVGPGGIRVPAGVDLSDPRQVEGLLREALGEGSPDWERVAQLVAVHEGRLPDDVRQRLLAEIKEGNRAGALRALGLSRDGSLTRDLVALYDEPGIAPAARVAILNALAKLPGANPGEVVREIEARLTGRAREDIPALRAIGQRGGKEAARAIVDYLLRTDDPARVSAYGSLGLDLAGNAETAEVIARAFREVQDPARLESLVRIAGQPGAASLVEPLLALERPDAPEGVRREVYEALARIGSMAAVDHLLATAAQPGTYGGVALGAIGRMRSASREARAKLLAALDDAPRAPDSSRARVELLNALGNLSETSAAPAMAKAVRDADPYVQQAGVRGLGSLGEAGRTYVPDLLEVFRGGSEAIQRQVASALGGIGGPEARAALESFTGNAALPPTVLRTARMALQRLARAETDAPPGGAAPGGG